MTERIEVPRVEPAIEPAERVRSRGRRRIRGVTVTLCAMLALVGVRGAWLCLAPSSLTLQAAVAQRWDQVTLRAQRGDILDRNGLRLATSIPTPNVVVDPFLIADDQVDALAARVARVVGGDAAEIAERMRRESRYQRVAVQVHPAVAREIEALDHDAVWVEREPRRYYPEQTLAAQVLGFVDAAGAGREGLEASLDSWLRGEAVLVQRDRNAVTDDASRASEVSRGLDVELTLDRAVQRIAERALDGVMARSAPRSASAVVVDVRTGDLLAIANTPTFNPNALGPEAAPRRNHAVQDAIEPGSVMKPFTVASAVQEKLVSAETIIDCEGGEWLVGRNRIRDEHPHGAITVRELLKYSSNIGAAKLAFELGGDRFVGYLHAFGFGERANTMLAGERAGVVRDGAHIRPIELATTAFGQGVTITPLQLAYAMAALGNDGVRMRPRLVRRVRDAHGVPEFVQNPAPAATVVSAQTARLVVSMMEGVTEDGGTAVRARVPGYRVAGKTGTAQKAEDGHYGSGRIGSFVGLVPADRPVLAIVVTVDEPTVGSRYGGVVAAPAFSEIASATLRYLGVPPDPGADAAPVVASAAADRAPAPAPAPEPEWDGRFWSVPDLRGYSMREVVAHLGSTDLALSLDGSGDLIRQDPPAGLLPPGSRLSLTFR